MVADDGADARVPSPDRRDLSYDDIEPGDPLGRGGNADVRRARLPDGTAVALKEPRFQGTLRTETVEAFVAEAETWATIDDHPNVVGLVDWGGAPMPWIAMEYMDGGSLGDRLAEGPLELDAASRVGRAACEAVRHAHRHGIAHLDLKPANVLFRAVDGGPDVPKVADWGLARFLAEHSGSVEGLSPQYAAPEQFDPETHGDPDDFTDIYQLGAVLYEALTGRPPFEGSGVAVMRAVLDDEPDPLTSVDPALPAAVDDVLGRALATEKRDRYETVVDLRRALGELSGGGTRGGSTAPAGDGTASGAAASSTDDEGPATAGERVEGVVDFFNDTGGYGFIEAEDIEEDVFFHMEDVGGPDLAEGQRVEFAVEQAENGPRAVELTRLGADLTGSAGDSDPAETPGADPTDVGTDRAGEETGPVTGIVDFFNDTGGYGFIEAEDVEEDVFFHMEDIGGPDLAEGQEVQFAVEWAENGPRATDLRRL